MPTECWFVDFVILLQPLVICNFSTILHIALRCFNSYSNKTWIYLIVVKFKLMNFTFFCKKTVFSQKIVWRNVSTVYLHYPFILFLRLLCVKFSLFWKELKGRNVNVFTSNSCLMTKFYFKCLLTRQIMTLRVSVYDIHGQNLF